MGNRLVVVTSVVGLIAAAGCSHNEAQPKTVRDGAVALTGGGQAKSVPYVEAGTTFDVRLDQPIDTRISNQGDAISATLVDALRTSDGSVLIPAGTRIYGKIASIVHANPPRIELDFQSLGLPSGAVPIGVRVVSAQETGYQAIPQPSGVTNAQPTAQAQQQPQGTQQITMTKGAMIRLSLTRPIVDVQGLSK